MYPNLAPHHPSYYRSHPFNNQYDLPNSAFKNRQLQKFYSQIPQGREYFDQGNKKHFNNVSYRSEIEDDNVLKETYPQQQQERSRIAMDRSYFRSLNVDDIEGAKPNTLISKAVKNREKALNALKKEEQSSYKQYSPQSIQTKPRNYSISQSNPVFSSMNNDSFVYKQNQAINKFSKNKSILQNNSTRILTDFNTIGNNSSQIVENTNNSQGISNKGNFHYRGNPQTVQQQQNQSSNKPVNVNQQIYSNPQGQSNLIERNKYLMEKQLEEKERRIRQLERELGVKKDQKKFSQNGYREQLFNRQKTYQGYLGYPYRPQQQYQQYYATQTKHVDNLPVVNINPPGGHQYENYSNFQQPQQRPYIQTNQSNRVEQIQPKHPNDQRNPYFQQPIHYQANQQPTNYYDHQQMNIYGPNIQNIDRSNIRKYNPTYLSYESEAIMDARNDQIRKPSRQ